MAEATPVVCLHDRAQIERFLRRNTFLHIYGLGDLDDSFWPFTTWYALADGAELRALALMYSGLSRPTLLALGGQEEQPRLEELLTSLLPLLPPRFYAHLNSGLSDVLRTRYAVDSHGEHLKMALTDAGRLAEIDVAGATRLTAADAAEMPAFYDASYPGHWFEPGALAAGPYFGLRGPHGLLSVAGTHVYSPPYKVAALGNITTHPTQRGKGCARIVTAALCRDLLKTVSHVGLNVKAANAPAIRCYQALGFEAIASYEECAAALRTGDF